MRSQNVRTMQNEGVAGTEPGKGTLLIPAISRDISRIPLFLHAVRYGRVVGMLPPVLLTVKKSDGGAWRAQLTTPCE
jgi:hypothetical protein